MSCTLFGSTLLAPSQLCPTQCIQRIAQLACAKVMNRFLAVCGDPDKRNKHRAEKRQTCLAAKRFHVQTGASAMSSRDHSTQGVALEHMLHGSMSSQIRGGGGGKLEVWQHRASKALALVETKELDKRTEVGNPLNEEMPPNSHE